MCLGCPVICSTFTLQLARRPSDAPGISGPKKINRYHYSYCLLQEIIIYYLSGDCLTKCILPDSLSFILHGTNHQIRIFCKGKSCFFYIIQIPQIFIKFRQAGTKPRYYSQYKFPCTECLLVSLNEPEPDLTSIMLSLCDLYQASQQMPDLLSHNPGVSNCC